ncbi:MAG TPA: response regulator transcription factor, partial [Patescibacteria group bacterium]|nr:response regulator transcription factor [Patescibacteria group bacterium]
GAARTVGQARELLARDGDRPDIVLCDIQLEAGIDGLDVISAAHEAGAQAIVLTSFDRSSLMRAAFERGASGFLDKRTDPSEILAAVRAVAAGGTAFSAATLDAARYAPRPPSLREIEVIREIQRGSTSDEIGGRLGISTRTVESHLRRLFDRYGVVSRAELAVLAINEGWVEAAR